MPRILRALLAATLFVGLTAVIPGCSPSRAPEPEIPYAYPPYAPPAQDERYDEEIAELEDEELVEDDDPSALTQYDKELEPYGAWIDDPEYGTVWLPDDEVVGDDFVPYKTAGHWAVAEDDSWVWVSDYHWGHIPFHYGRWVWIPELGWAWVPGRTYAPAWVVWRVGEPGYDYVGWAPMPPSWCWYRGWATVCHADPILAFWFVPSVYLFHPYWHHHIVPRHHVHVIARHTRVHPRHRPPMHRPAHLKARARATYRPTSPTFSEAGVPKHAVPSAEARVKRTPTRTTIRRPGARRPVAAPTHRRPYATPAPTKPPVRKVTRPRPREPVMRTPGKRVPSKGEATPRKRVPSKKKVTPRKRVPSKKKVTPRKRVPSKKKATPRRRSTTRTKVTPTRRAAPRKRR